MYATFDAIAYARKLEQAGFTREQAEIQAENVRELRESQAESLRSFSKELDEKTKKELATKGDLRETELRLQKEIEQVRKEIEQVRVEIKSTEYRLLLWQIGIGVAIISLIAKGFGWLGF